MSREILMKIDKSWQTICLSIAIANYFWNILETLKTIVCANNLQE